MADVANYRLHAVPPPARSVLDHPGRQYGTPPVDAAPMLTSIPASVARLPAGDECLDAGRPTNMFFGGTLLKRSAVSTGSSGRLTIALRTARQ